MGKRGWKSLFFITFFNFIHSKISKKIGFRGPPLLSLEGGKEDDNELKSINCSY
mgnify:FL=1